MVRDAKRGVYCEVRRVFVRKVKEVSMIGEHATLTSDPRLPSTLESKVNGGRSNVRYETSSSPVGARENGISDMRLGNNSELKQSLQQSKAI